MQTVTFTCPHCNNLMAATADMLGQQVHCPTCGNVVIAPAAPQASAPELAFDRPPREAHDSIFGEIPDEDVLGGGSKPPKVELPQDPPPETNTSPQPAPVFEIDLPPAPPALEPQWTMPAVPLPTETPQEPPPDSWGTTPTPDPQPQPAADHWQSTGETSADDFDGEPVTFRRPEETRERQKGRSLMLAILTPYSIIMTVIAIYFLYKYQTFESKNHPLELMGDHGLLGTSAKKKDQSINFRGVKRDTELPDRLKVGLNSTIRIGDLEVTPRGIEQGKIVSNVLMTDGRTVTQNEGTGLLLKLRLKNVSPEWCFCPMDPIFDRYYDPRRDKDAEPYTLLQVGAKYFFGGPLDQLKTSPREKRKYISGQENDDKLLNPGEERDTVVATDPRDDTLIPAVMSCRDPMTWRVHLRRGIIRYKGSDWSTTAVIGVEFTAADIKKK